MGPLPARTVTSPETAVETTQGRKTNIIDSLEIVNTRCSSWETKSETPVKVEGRK